MKTPDFIVGRAATAAKIAIGFAVVFACAPFGMMTVADLLTPNASGVLSVQVGSFLPILHALLVGLTVLFLWVFVPAWSILSTLSVLVAGVRRTWLARASILAVAFGSLAVGAFWAPNPLVQWPISILGDHEPHQLIRDLFPFHLVQPEWIGPVDGSFDVRFSFTFHWQLAETVARCGVVALFWALGLATIHRFGRPLSANCVAIKPRPDLRPALRARPS